MINNTKNDDDDDDDNDSNNTNVPTTAMTIMKINNYMIKNLMAQQIVDKIQLKEVCCLFSD